MARDLIAGVPQRIFNVGRLDYMTSGLIFFTNDGEFSQLISHPSTHLEKEYVVTTKKAIPEDLMKQFVAGLRVNGELYKAKSYRLKGPHTVHLILEEGRNQELRKVFLSRSITVKKIHRVRIGSVTVKGLPPGHFRKLKDNEVERTQGTGPEEGPEDKGGGEIMIVAIDGPAGVGKSTVAQSVADRFGFFNLNSGNFYRAVALKALDRGIAPESEKELSALAASLDLDIIGGRLHLDGTDVEDELHTDRVDRVVSPVSACVPVRHIVNDHIRRITAGMNVVAEGRDMTSVVFPHGEVKFFLDASPLARAQRRFRQGVSELSLEEIRRNIEERDRKDRNKKEGSLKITEDAEYLDTSDLTLDQVCERVFDKIKEYIVDPGE